LRYCDARGEVTPEANPNGALANVAGVCNARGNVFGLMPHPEHAVDALFGGEDGKAILGSLVDAVRGGAR
jgi:phosphoribosylformylglycinamidine synthase